MVPISATLSKIKPLLKKAANGGRPLVVMIIIPIKAKDIGRAFRNPPINRMSLVPSACMMPPARRNPRPSKNAWLTMWKRLANQPMDAAPATAVPKPAIMKPIWLTVEYARTPFIFVAKKDVTISGLNTAETVRIFRGDTKTWPDGKRVRLIVRPSTELDTLLVKQISPEMSNAVDIALSHKGYLMAMTDQDCLDLIEKTPGGLGFATLTQVLSEKRQLKVLLFNGLRPSSKALADGSYPFYKTLYFVTKTEPSVWVRKFIDFVRSPEGRKVLEETGNLVTIDRSGR